MSCPYACSFVKKALLMTISYSHVHSVMGAFGLNASIMDASNLAWKLGLVARGKAKMHELLSTYNSERRDHAVRIIEASGEYLRFVCATDLPIADLRNLGTTTEIHDSHKSADFAMNDITDTQKSIGNSDLGVETAMDGHTNGSTDMSVQSNNTTQVNGHKHESEKKAATTNAVNVSNDKSTNGSLPTNGSSKGQSKDKVDDQNPKPQPDQTKDLQFLSSFFGRYGQFLLGVDAPFSTSVIASDQRTTDGVRPFEVNHGVRAPNPRVCFSQSSTGYLYDKMRGASLFHIVIFASSLEPGSQASSNVSRFTESALMASSGFYERYGGADRFNVVLVVKCLPFEIEWRLAQTEELARLGEIATVVFDDRAPDEDAHTTWGANHSTGAVAVVRPDLWVGMTAFPDEVAAFDAYFGGFLEPVASSASSASPL